MDHDPRSERVTTHLSVAGRLVLAVALTTLVLSLFVDHPGLWWIAVLSLSSFACSLPTRRALHALHWTRSPAATLIEGEIRMLDLELSSPSRLPLLHCFLRAREPLLRMEGAIPLLRGPAVVPARWRALRRGPLRELCVHLESSAPFGLLTHRRVLIAAADIAHLPRPARVRPEAVKELVAPRRLEARTDSGSLSLEGEFYGVRAFRPGDSEQTLHPRLSARRGTKMLRILRGEDHRHLRLAISLLMPPDASATRFEQAVRLTAGVVMAQLATGGSVTLCALDEEGERVICESSRRDLHDYLFALLPLQPTRSTAVPPQPAARITVSAGGPGAGSGHWITVRTNAARRLFADPIAWSSTGS